MYRILSAAAERVVLVGTDYSPCVLHPSVRRSRPHHDTGCCSCRDGNADVTSDHTTKPEHVNAHSLAIRDFSAPLSLKPSARSSRGLLRAR